MSRKYKFGEKEGAYFISFTHALIFFIGIRASASLKCNCLLDRCFY